MGIIINPRQIIKDGITSLRDVWSSNKISTELSGKQATLVSGTNIKTINNTSLLGSGDITISGGGDIPRIDMTATTATLDPNKFYVWGEVASLDISLAAETAGIENVYKFQFQSGATPINLILPNNVSIDGEYPNKPYGTYIISLESNIAKIERQKIQPILPQEYQQVEYLEATGTQYILLNHTASNTTVVDVKCVVREDTMNATIIGTRQSAGVDTVLYANYDTFHQIFGYGAYSYYSINSLLDQVAEVHLENGTCIINGVTYIFSSQNQFAYNNRLCVFGLNQAGSVMRLSKARILELSVDGDNIVPCYRIADSVAGLYDINHGEFHTNAGSGSFIVGPDV